MADGSESFLDGLAKGFAPVHRDGQKFVAIGAVLSLLLFLVWLPLGCVMAVLTIWVAYAFRDPDRVVPLRDGLILAPADGTVEAIEAVRPDGGLELGTDERIRVSIHLSLFDVHIQRAPIAGEVMRSLYAPGSFGAVFADKASHENERRATVFRTADKTTVGVVQIAGGLRRRIVSFVREGERLGAGERFGMIRFGSRVDLYLPANVVPLVTLGQTMVGGETVVADIKSDEPERSSRVV